MTKFDNVSANKIPESQKIGLLRKAANADVQLLQAWSSIETIIANGSQSGTAIPYEKYMDYLVSHSEKLEEGAADNSGLKVNVADSHFMDSYLPEDSYYDEATSLATYMGERDVDMIHSMLECNQVLYTRN